jgi:outer membrane lipoprotein carrier protein
MFAKYLIQVIVSIPLFFGSAAARADALGTLKTFLQSAKTLSADFTQQVTKDGKSSRSASGQFELSRPNRFRFEYTRPYEQSIVSDGQKLWLYDKDLNQVTVKNYAEALAASPAAILAGSAAPEQFYALKALPAANGDGLEWLEAVPKAKDSLFQSIRLAFRNGELAVMELRDNFGATSRISFANVKRNPAIDEARFRFVPPPKADVLQQ